MDLDRGEATHATDAVQGSTSSCASCFRSTSRRRQFFFDPFLEGLAQQPSTSFSGHCSSAGFTHLLPVSQSHADSESSPQLQTPVTVLARPPSAPAVDPAHSSAAVLGKFSPSLPIDASPLEMATLPSYEIFKLHLKYWKTVEPVGDHRHRLIRGPRQQSHLPCGAHQDPTAEAVPNREWTRLQNRWTRLKNRYTKNMSRHRRQPDCEALDVHSCWSKCAVWERKRECRTRREREASRAVRSIVLLCPVWSMPGSRTRDTPLCVMMMRSKDSVNCIDRSRYTNEQSAV